MVKNRGKYLTVTVPVADIRRKPVDAKPQYIQDDVQETQVLYNEALLYRDEIQDWYYVETTEQQKLASYGVWQGYPGWIRKENAAFIVAPPEYNAVTKSKVARILSGPSGESDVMIQVLAGTRLLVSEAGREGYFLVGLGENRHWYIGKNDVNTRDSTPDESALRKAIVDAASLFLGAPYLWGGRSMYVPDLQPGVRGLGSGVNSLETRNPQGSIPPKAGQPETAVSGVDCSGLTNLAYRINNIDIPRDAQDQWLRAEKIAYDRLKPGDLIFISEEGRPSHATHVMLYAGEERFIEAAETGSVVTVKTFAERFGRNLSGLAEVGFTTDGKQIYFGRIISVVNE